jgi:hypothetical protein
LIFRIKPSILDGDEQNLYRAATGFLHEFTDDLTKPIAKDGREHIEYVPPQVVTEYVRYRLQQHVGRPVHGILYRSKVTRALFRQISLELWPCRRDRSREHRSAL